MRTRSSLLSLVTAFWVLGPALVLADAEGDLDRAIASKDKDKAAHALAEVVGPGDAKAAASFLRALPKMRDLDMHKDLLEAIRAFKEEGVGKLADAAKHEKDADTRYLLVEGLSLQGSPAAARAVLDGLEDKEDKVVVIAARSIRHCGSTDVVEKLIARLETAEKRPREATLCREINGALSIMTGESLSFGLEWRGWWMTHKDGWKPKEEAGAGGGSSSRQGSSKGESGSGDEPSSGGGGGTISRRMQEERPADARTISRMTASDVLVVKGRTDAVEKVLQAINVKHTLLQKADISKRDLDPKAILVLNCDGSGKPYDDDEIAKIREFVEKGGYLWSSDWELRHTMQRAFPGAIEYGGDSSRSNDEDYKVDIRPTADGSRSPLLRDVFPATTWDAGSLNWLMCGRSHLIKVLSPDVHVLIESKELGKRFPEMPAVAVTFAWRDGKVQKPRTFTGNGGGAQASGGGANGSNGTGSRSKESKDGGTGSSGGCVVHVLSHFKNQQDKSSGDKFALQQLLLNFFLEKQAANKAAQH